MADIASARLSGGEAQIDEKVRRLAAEYELDPALVSDVLRAVIDRVVAEHRALAD